LPSSGFLNVFLKTQLQTINARVWQGSWWLGPTVFRGNFAKFCGPAHEITRLIAAKSSKFRSSPRPHINDWKLRELFRNFSYWRLALY